MEKDCRYLDLTAKEMNEGRLVATALRKNRKRTQVKGVTAHSSIQGSHMSPLAIQAQDDTLHPVQQGTLSTRRRASPRPRPRARPHPHSYPPPRPHPSLHLTAAQPPLFLPKSTAALLTHLCTIEQTPVRLPHAYLAQRAAPGRTVRLRNAFRAGVLRPRPAPGARPCVTYAGMAASDAAARQNRPRTRAPSSPQQQASPPHSINTETVLRRSPLSVRVSQLNPPSTRSADVIRSRTHPSQLKKSTTCP